MPSTVMRECARRCVFYTAHCLIRMGKGVDSNSLFANHSAESFGMTIYECAYTCKRAHSFRPGRSARSHKSRLKRASCWVRALCVCEFVTRSFCTLCRRAPIGHGRKFARAPPLPRDVRFMVCDKILCKQWRCVCSLLQANEPTSIPRKIKALTWSWFRKRVTRPLTCKFNSPRRDRQQRFGPPLRIFQIVICFPAGF